MSEKYDDPPECFLCGGTQRHHQDYGELKERPIRDPKYSAPDHHEWLHDQCWVEWNALCAHNEPYMVRTDQEAPMPT